MNLTYWRENNKQFCQDKRKAELKERVRDSPADSLNHLGVDWRRREEQRRGGVKLLVLVRERSVTLRVSLEEEEAEANAPGL